MQKQQVINFNFSKQLLAGIFLLIAVLLRSQTLDFKITSNVKTSVKSNNGFMNAIVMAENNGIVYFTLKNPSDEKSVKIYSLDISKNLYDSIIISKNKSTKDFMGERKLSIEATNKEFIVVTDGDIFIFKNNRKSPDLITRIKNPKFYNYIYKLNNNEFLLYVNYDFHPMDAKDKHLWAKLNVEKGIIEHQHKMADDNVMFSYFVNSWISTYKGLIAYTETTKYKIKFYDSNFNVIDSLQSNKLDSNEKYLGSLKNVNTQSKDGIYKVKEIEDSLLIRIQKIYLLDSTHVLVMLKLPFQKEYEYETWLKKSGNWEQDKVVKLPFWYIDKMSYTRNNPPFTKFVGNVDGILYLGKHQFISVYYPYREFLETKSFNKKEDFENPTNEMIKKGDLYFGIHKFVVYE